jgi:hypothetical protein
MKEKYVIVKGCAGLGNRLFTVCNAIEYCVLSKRKIYIDWSDGQFAPKGNNVFTRYFTLKNINTVIDINEITTSNELTFYPEIWKKNINKGIYDSFAVSEINSFHPTLFKSIPEGRTKMLKRYWQYLENTSITQSSKTKNHFAGVLNKNNFPFGSDLSKKLSEDVIVFADFSPPYSEIIFLNHIKLKPELEEKINRFVIDKELTKNTIGIHVRSTDKKPTKNLDLLFEKISDLPLNNPRVFLATDNKYVLDEFENKFPSLVMYPKFLPKNIQNGLHQYALYNDNQDISIKLFEDSIIDMWLLSMCEYLLYQGNSSFSIISNILHRDKRKAFDWLN